ncbi:hypothetical protein KIH27_01065 [Mycobacterium sp. M1]|uniref:Uncharacterized protein n=1 Tax=Mycolicibacter acidiphilus TaxID=2835306 RepID=A0ABS5RD07_9MYCO|nr:hypothetical protein [Mycolicibacter acidiphilus]MBS9532173.1 hypothetical protein [Mycolicibacter acidiphilus]
MTVPMTAKFVTKHAAVMMARLGNRRRASMIPPTRSPSATENAVSPETAPKNLAAALSPVSAATMTQNPMYTSENAQPRKLSTTAAMAVRPLGPDD